MPLLITRDGVGIQYQKFGGGRKKVVFITGFGSPYEGWALQLEHFGKHLTDSYQVVGVDNRGAGLSDVPYLPFTIATMADDVREVVVREWGAEQKVHVVGISMGGMISLEYAHKYPDTLASLSLVNTHAGGVRALPVVNGVINIAKMAAMGDTSVWGDIAFGGVTPRSEWRALGSSYMKSSRSIFSVEDHGDMVDSGRSVAPRPRSASTRMRGLLLQLGAVGTHYVSTSRLEQIRDSGIPVLVIVGTDDAVIRPSNSRVLAQILKATLMTLDGHGHVPCIEAPFEFNAILHSFFTEQEEEREDIRGGGKDQRELGEAADASTTNRRYCSGVQSKL